MVLILTLSVLSPFKDLLNLELLGVHAKIDVPLLRVSILSDSLNLLRLNHLLKMLIRLPVERVDVLSASQLPHAQVWKF